MITPTLLAAVVAVSAAHETTRPIAHAITIDAPAESVWERWTTPAGLTLFFARAVNVGQAVGEPYEILFFPDNPPGRRGAEGTRLMALEPPRRLAFDWDAPPHWPNQRGQRTMVEIRLMPTESGTRVELRHGGFGDGEDWQAVRDYFDAAWPKILARLAYSYEHDAIDWDDPPPGLMHRSSVD